MESYSHILQCALDVGEAMLKSGAEVNRVEDTINRICKAYGVEHTDVFAIPNSIVATVRSDDGHVSSQTRRISHNETNFDTLKKLNQLSRDICSKPCKTTEVTQSVYRIMENANESRSLYLLMAFIFGTASFTLLFGGSYRDAYCTVISAVILYFLRIPLGKIWINKILYNAILAAFSGVFAFFYVKWGMADSVSKIVLGEIMLFIPGIELTNGIRDLMAEDVVAGLSHLCEAISIAVAVAMGAAGALLLMEGIFA